MALVPGKELIGLFFGDFLPAIYVRAGMAYADGEFSGFAGVRREAEAFPPDDSLAAVAR